MSKFKAGDKVYWEFDGEKQYREVSHVSDGDRVFFTSGFWMSESALFFAEGPEDLPEVPENVRYECNQNPGNDFLEVKGFSGHVFIDVQEEGQLATIELTPASALQLSADLLRIALQLKRKEEEERNV